MTVVGRLAPSPTGALRQGTGASAEILRGGWTDRYTEGV